MRRTSAEQSRPIRISIAYRWPEWERDGVSFSRMSMLGLAALLVVGCAGHSSQFGSDIDAPDANAFVSGTDLHRQDERNQVIRVAGCVRHPGAFTLGREGSMNLEEALQLAGGPNPASAFKNKASLASVRVSRLQDNAVTTINVDARPGRAGQTFIVQPGDEIFVPEEMMPFP